MGPSLFRRAHHQRIARVLDALDADLLAEHSCWFGGGTAMALLNDEYRESVDLDFLVSDQVGYRSLRMLVRETGMSALAPAGLEVVREPRMDSYGIRMAVVVDGTPIKFEIIHEGRIDLDTPDPESQICGVRHLTVADQVASKLLANDDRWADPAVFSRDLIDLALTRPNRADFSRGMMKAVDAYGTSVTRSLGQAVDQLRNNPQRLDAILQALNISLPRASVFAAIVQLSERSSSDVARQDPSD